MTSSNLTIYMTRNNKAVILVGAGAVENAWFPILNAFKILLGYEIDMDAANCLFARYVYLLRFYSKLPNAQAIDNLKIETEQVNFIKKIICEQIEQAQNLGIIRPRQEFKKILNEFIFNDVNNEFSLISTNWDTTIDNEADKIVQQVYLNVKSSKCFHIHGSIEFPHKLYLPSEMSYENYRLNEENEKSGYNHFLTIRILEQANQIILYGLSLDPLDAELSQVLNGACSANNNLREIIIINPDYDKIRNRVKVLLPNNNNIKIRCFLPENLQEEII